MSGGAPAPRRFGPDARCPSPAIADGSCDFCRTAAASATGSIPSLGSRCVRRHVRHAERGVVLLEVMIATVVLGVAGTALIALLAQALRDEQRLRDRERTMDAAERVLVTETLLAHDDLDRRIGRHPMGAFVADVQRPRPTLYR